MMHDINYLWSELKGYKTYIVAIAAVVYGVYVGDPNTVYLGLGLAGLRSGISHEVAKAATSKNPVQEVEKVAVEQAAQVAATVVEAQTSTQ